MSKYEVLPTDSGYVKQSHMVYNSERDDGTVEFYGSQAECEAFVRGLSDKKYNISTEALAGFEVPGSNGRRVFTNIEAKGDNLDELLDNATIGIDDWHGNDLEARSVGELPARLYVKAIRAIEVEMNKVQTHE